MNLFKVVNSGARKAVDEQSFSNKEEAKVYRDELNKGAGYNPEEDISGRKMPFKVSKDVDHWAY